MTDYQVMPPLADEDFAALKADIEARGVLVPVEYDEDGNILDGHHRVQACKELGITDWPRFIRKGLSEDDKRAHARQLNLARRHLNREQKRELIAAQLKETPERSNRQVAEGLGVDHKTVAAVRSEAESIGEIPQCDRATSDGRTYPAQRKPVRTAYVDPTPEGKQETLAVAKDIRKESQQERKQKADEKLAALRKREVASPDGRYDVIVIDPPWPMEKIERDVRPNQVAFDYPTMSEQQICALEMPASDDCHLWCWTTHKFLPMALRCIDAWGFRYVCTFVWHKPGGFQPIGLPQYNCEFALYARKGSPRFTDTKAFNAAFSAPRGAHSEKPEEFYEVLRRVTAGRRLDMFNRRHIDGFDGWGNESGEQLAG